MPQIQLDALTAIRASLPELVKQLEIMNKINLLRLQCANGGFASKEDFVKIEKMLAD